MTEEVGQLVLRNNYLQSLAISTLQAHAAERISELGHVIHALERAGTLNRALEALPSEDEIGERRRKGLGLTRPELAMLLSYSKIWLSDMLCETDVAHDSFLAGELTRYFPPPVQRRYPREILRHQLRSDIIVTATTNSLVNRMGPVFAIRAQEDTGADVGSIARAYAIAREITGMRDLWADIESLDDKAPTGLQYDMMYETSAPAAPPELLGAARARHRSRHRARRVAAAPGHPRTDARPAGADRRHRSRPLRRVAAQFAKRRRAATRRPPRRDAGRRARGRRHRRGRARAPRRDRPRGAVYFGLGAALGLDWMRGEIDRLVVEGHWQAIARGTLREEAYSLQRRLVDQVLARGRRSDLPRAWPPGSGPAGRPSTTWREL